MAKMNENTLTFSSYCIYSITEAGCSMEDTSLTKVSMETQPLHLCLRELKELLLLKSIHMQPMAPGFRYTHTDLHINSRFPCGAFIFNSLS